MPSLSLLGLLIVIGASLTGAGCQGSCQSLADRICSCKPSRSEEIACMEQVRIGDRRTLTELDEQICSDLLETCTCEALEREDERSLSVCGLAKGLRREPTPGTNP